jgi:hypothetical protein
MNSGDVLLLYSDYVPFLNGPSDAIFRDLILVTFC